MTTVPASSLLAEHDALLCDLDGVVYEGANAIPGAVEALNAAIDAGLEVAFVTNNASRAPEVVAQHLRDLGVRTDAEHIFGSARAGARLAADAAAERGLSNPTVLVIGAQTLRDEAVAAGLSLAEPGEPADVLLQGFDPGLGWADLANAAFAIQAGALWVATNTDITIPRERGIAPGNGTLVAAVRQAVDVDPLVAGKPEPGLMQVAARALGVRRPLVIGDRLDTDVAGGNAAGFRTALVLTGVHTRDDAAAAEAALRPDVIVEDLQQLLAPGATA